MEKILNFKLENVPKENVLHIISLEIYYALFFMFNELKFWKTI